VPAERYGDCPQGLSVAAESFGDCPRWLAKDMVTVPKGSQGFQGLSVAAEWCGDCPRWLAFNVPGASLD
jgi:hypothetical protein